MVASCLRMLARVLAVLTRRRDDEDLDQELDAHLGMLVDDYRRNGLSERDARRAALLAVGGRAQLREEHRRTRGLQWLEDLIVDLRYACRACARQPGFTMTVVVTLAIGIGANTAMFSVVRSVLLEPRPYANAERLVTVSELWPQLPGPRPASMLNYEDWVRQNTVFDRIAAVSQFAANPAIVGTSIHLDGQSYTIVGVMPPHSSIEFLDPQIWRPLTFETLPPRGSRTLRLAVARLKPGVTRAQSQTEMQVIAKRLAAQYPESNRDYGVVVEARIDPVGALRV